MASQLQFTRVCGSTCCNFHQTVIAWICCLQTPGGYLIVSKPGVFQTALIILCVCVLFPQIWSQNPSTACPGDDLSVQKWQVKIWAALDFVSTLLSHCILYLVVWTCLPCASLKDKLRAILKATYTHSRNLAYFVFTYKGLQALQERMQGKSSQSHAFLAACVGGYLVFGDNNNINSQVWFKKKKSVCHVFSFIIKETLKLLQVRCHFQSNAVFFFLSDQHVLAVQNPVRTVSASGGERMDPPAQTRPFSPVCHPGMGHCPVAVWVLPTHPPAVPAVLNELPLPWQQRVARHLRLPCLQ